MALVKYTATSVAKSDPSVAVWKRGQIGFNKALVNQLGLKESNYVVLYFDSVTKEMGFGFTNDSKAEGALKIGSSKTGVGTITASPFLNYFGVDFSVSKRFTMYYDETNKIHMINVTQGTIVVPKKPKVKPLVATAPADTAPNVATSNAVG